MRTCLVDQLNPGLVQALTGEHCDSRVLQFTARGNSFIEPVPGKHGCYRYQSLYREFLRSHLLCESAELVPILHRTAAEWLVRDGQFVAGVRHAVSAEAWPMATHELVEGLRFGALLAGGQRGHMRQLFARLPADTQGAEAAVTRAALALAEFDPDRCAAGLNAARTQLGRTTSSGGRCALAILILEAVARSLGADLDAGLASALTAEGALRASSPDDVAAHPELRVIVAGCKGRVLFQRGDFVAARAALTEGIEAGQASDLGGELMELEGMAALVEAVTGNLRQASAMVTRTLLREDNAGSNSAPQSQAAILALAWVRMDEYDLQAAQDLVRRAERAASTFDAGVLSGVLALLRGRLLATQNDIALARAELQAATNSGNCTGWLYRSILLEDVASLLVQGRAEEAIRVVRTLSWCDRIECEVLLQRAHLASDRDAPALAKERASSLVNAPLEVRVARWLVLAEQSLRERDSAHGEFCLEQALRLAAPEHLRRPFFEAPEEVRTLMKSSGFSSRSHWLLKERDAPAAGVDAAGPGERKDSWVHGGRHGAPRLVNPLTTKEYEVLSHLAELLTTREIAEAMFVSVNTVRTHVRSILRKLGVARRNEAVRRAWELGLLSSRSAA